MRTTITSAIVLTLLTLLAGCKKEETINVYSAPKDPPPSPAAVMPVADTNAPPPGHAQAMAQAAGPLQWTVPAGWKQLPGSEMRFASFLVNEEPPLQMSVIPLGMESGAVAPNVNRWEQQMGLPPSEPDKMGNVLKKVSTNGLEINTVDLTGPETATPRMRMLAAMLKAGGKVWFFKLVGPADLVAKQKDNFDAFIKSLKPGEGANAPAIDPLAAAPGPVPGAGAAPMPAIPATGSLKIAKFKAGEDWKETPGSKAPRMIAFSVGPDDKKADLIVTRFGAHGAGTMLDNVNRWRGQIGLPPVPDAKELPMTDVTAGKDNPGVLITIDNPGGAGAPAKRIAVAIISVGPDLWFFKLVGPPETLDKNKAAFEAFLKSLEFAPESAAAEEKP